jgi:hypothetical protein
MRVTISAAIGPPCGPPRRARVNHLETSGATLSALNAVQQAQRGALMPWSAVALGLGVALYFSLPVEPGARACAGRWSSFVLGIILASGGGDARPPRPHAGLGGGRGHGDGASRPHGRGAGARLPLLRAGGGTHRRHRPVGLRRAAADAGPGAARRRFARAHAAPGAGVAPRRPALACPRARRAGDDDGASRAARRTCGARRLRFPAARLVPVAGRGRLHPRARASGRPARGPGALRCSTCA